MIVTEKSAAPSSVIVTEKVRSECFGKKYGPSRVIVTEKEGAAPSRVIVTEKARLRALRERRTIPSPSGKSTIRVLRKKVRSECFGKKYGPSVSGKVYDPESVGKKRGSEYSGKSA